MGRDQRRDALGERAVDAGVDDQVGDACVVEEDGNLEAPVGFLRAGFGAENQLAFLGEEDARPTRTRRSRRALRRRRGGRCRRRRPRARIWSIASSAAAAVTRRRPSKARICSRKRSGTGSDFRRAWSIQTSVCFAVTISSSSSPSGELVGGVVVGHARRADPLDAHEHLEQVVEARRPSGTRRSRRASRSRPRRRGCRRGRGAGGTPCARGRSRACSGRSRQRPERRSPRTQPACTPRTETAVAGRSCAQARSRADPSRVPARRGPRGRTAGAWHRRLRPAGRWCGGANAVRCEARCVAEFEAWPAAGSTLRSRAVRQHGADRRSARSALSAEAQRAPARPQEAASPRGAWHEVRPRDVAAYRLLPVPGTGVRPTGRGRRGQLLVPGTGGSPLRGRGWRGQLLVPGTGGSPFGTWPAGSTAGAWHPGVALRR